MNRFFAILALASLVAFAVPARGADSLPALTPEKVWAFFEALPDADLPEGIATRAEREAFHKEYEEQRAAFETATEDEGYYGDYLDEIDNQLFWSPTILDPAWMQEVAEDLTEENGPISYIILSVYPGADPDRLFGILELREDRSGGSRLMKTTCYWYSVSQKKATATALPLDVPYTDADLTDDGLLLLNKDELYWSMRDRCFDWIEEPERLIVTIQGVGATPVCYDWNGTKFVRDRSYSPMLVYSNGVGEINFGDPIPYSIHGYSTDWIPTEEDNVHAWGYIKEGESQPRIVIYAYGYGPYTVDAIDVLYPGYKLFEKIYVGMPAAEAMEILKEFYSYDEEGRDPYVSEFDGKAWIFSGHEDPYQIGVDPEFFKNGKLTPDAKVSVISIAPAVG